MGFSGGCIGIASSNKWMLQQTAEKEKRIGSEGIVRQRRLEEIKQANRYHGNVTYYVIWWEGKIV
jgi:hypothetical protein